MKKRIPAKVREEAAEFCSAIACQDEIDHIPDTACACAFCVAEEIEPSGPARLLAAEAWAEVQRGLPPITSYVGNEYGQRYAEAEALLRTGWSPK